MIAKKVNLLYHIDTKGGLAYIFIRLVLFLFGGIRLSHYFTNEDLKSNVQKISTYILDENFSFYTDNGVFSKEKLDFGSRVLLENIPISEISGEVLDVGCGYGPIGIVLSKLTNAKVTMIDVNKRALHLVERNLKINQVSACVLESDAYASLENKTFDFILTNPPIHAGKQKVYEILMGAKEHLNPGGRLFLVIRKVQGAKSCFSDLEKYYNEVQVLEKNKGFFVISCKKP